MRKKKDKTIHNSIILIIHCKITECIININLCALKRDFTISTLDVGKKLKLICLWTNYLLYFKPENVGWRMLDVNTKPTETGGVW